MRCYRWLLFVPLLIAMAGCSSRGDPCKGVICNTPPSPVCQGDNLQVYGNPGTCKSGACTYPPVPKSCPYGCANGACIAATCADLVCDHPPADACSGTDVLLHYPQEGTCDPATVTCVYTPVSTPCPLGCTNNTCPECNSGSDCTLDPPKCLDATQLQTQKPHCLTHLCKPETVVTDCSLAGQVCQQDRCTSSIPSPKAGEVIVTEFMADPSKVADSSGEWFEILSLASAVRELSGVKLSNGGTSSVVISAAASFPIAAGARMVLGNNGDTSTNGGVTEDVDYGSLSLGNSAGSIVITAPDGTVIDTVAYDKTAGWNMVSGSSLVLKASKLDATANDDPANWCLVTETYGLGDFGTPGLAGGTCRECFTDPDCQVPAPVCTDSTHLTTTTVSCQAGLCQNTPNTVDCGTSGFVCQAAACKSPYRAPAAGDLIISELMADTKAVADSAGEWFELANLSADSLELGGLTVHDDSGQHFTIPTDRSYPVEAGKRFVLAVGSDPATNGGITPDYAYNYNSFSFNNTSPDAIVIEFPAGTVLDAVRYDQTASWKIVSGSSLALKATALDATANDDPANWCLVTESYGAGDFGTPGLVDGTCRQCFKDTDCQVPAPVCDDSTHLTTTTVSCQAGLCQNTPNTVDCSTLGFVCDSAACKSPYRAPVAGDLVISEFMANPKAVADTLGEWFELANISADTLELGGLTVHDNGTQKFTIPTDRSYPVATGQRFVLAVSSDPLTNGGITPNYAYSSSQFSLNNTTADAIVIEFPAGTMLDAVSYDPSTGWLIGDGISLQLREQFLNPTDNDTAANWCQTLDTYGSGDRGTPGKPNTNCAND